MLQLKNKAIFDSSALLAFYNDEPGWQEVEPYQEIINQLLKR